MTSYDKFPAPWGGNSEVAKFLNVEATALVKPLRHPQILLGIDVKVSDWDDQAGFAWLIYACDSGGYCLGVGLRWGRLGTLGNSGEL